VRERRATCRPSTWPTTSMTAVSATSTHGMVTYGTAPVRTCTSVTLGQTFDSFSVQSLCHFLRLCMHMLLKQSSETECLGVGAGVGRLRRLHLECERTLQGDSEHTRNTLCRLAPRLLSRGIHLGGNAIKCVVFVWSPSLWS